MTDWTLVVGYGIGPLVLSPITEIPQIGRNLPYIIPLAIFCVLQVPTALVDNFAGFIVLRFLGGFISASPLATGGGSTEYILMAGTRTLMQRQGQAYLMSFHKRKSPTRWVCTT